MPGNEPGRTSAAGRRPVCAAPIPPTKPRTVFLVLIAEDFRDWREAVAEYLGFYGFQTVEAENGLEAIKKAAELRPAIVLMDLALPGLDGWEATMKLKRDPATLHIPIIVITAHGLPDDERRAREAGCDAFLTKPVHPQELLREIHRLLEKPR